MLRILVILINIIIISTFAFCDSTYVEKVEDGVYYYLTIIDNGPVRIHTVEIDLKENDHLKLNVGISSDKMPGAKEKPSEYFIRKNDIYNNVLVVINGDFFGGSPHQAENINIISGEIAKGVKLDRSVFAFSKSRKPYIENFLFEGKAIHNNDTIMIDNLNKSLSKNEVNFYNHYYDLNYLIEDSLRIFSLRKIDENDTSKCNGYVVDRIINDKNMLKDVNNRYLLIAGKEKISNFINLNENDTILISLQIQPALDDYFCMIGGYPRLITDGKIPNTYIGVEGIKSEKFIGLNPRTAVGFNSDSSKVYFVVVDGRQPNFSIGMTLEQLSKYFEELKVTNAINLDGGGSSSIVIKGEVKNHPSDSTGERPVCNFLLLTN